MESGQIQGNITEVGLDRVRLVVSNSKNPQIADDFFFYIQEVIQILPIDPIFWDQALLLDFLDFESALEVVCAIANNLGAIVTLTHQNFQGSKLSVWSGKELLKCQSLESLAPFAKLKTETALDKASKLKTLSSELCQKPVSLSQWLQNNFVEAVQNGWVKPEDIFERGGANYFSFRSGFFQQTHGCIRAKEIDFANNRCSVALVVRALPQPNSQVDIRIQVYAIGNQISLPRNIRLIVLDDSGNPFMEAQAQSRDLGIQLECTAEHGDRFIVKVTLTNTSFSEYFIID